MLNTARHCDSLLRCASQGRGIEGKADLEIMNFSRWMCFPGLEPRSSAEVSQSVGQVIGKLIAGFPGFPGGEEQQGKTGVLQNLGRTDFIHEKVAKATA